MKTRILHLRDVLLSSYWFIPGVMIVGAGGPAEGLVSTDQAYGPLLGWGWLYNGGVIGARLLLQVIAGSVITVAGVVFSITITALALTATQMGPRLLQNFMRDRDSQVTLGTFVGTFIYCILVLRQVRGPDHTTFVPNLAVSVSVLLAIANVAVLVYFIHHIASKLQAPNVVAAVGDDLQQAVKRLFPEQIGHDRFRPDEGDGIARPELPGDFEHRARPGLARNTGYIQAVDGETLLQQASRHDLLLRLNVRPGDYVIAGTPLLHVWPGERCDPAMLRKLENTFITGRQRTNEQDIGFAINQIIEIAVRALSPGINDPLTATNCIDRLAAALVGIARGDLPGPYRYDDAGQLRIVTPVSSFADIVDASFSAIRQYGHHDLLVMMRLLEVLGQIGRQAPADQHRQVLSRHLEIVYQQATESIRQPHDRQQLERRYLAARKDIADVGT